jgi:small subunit ribosomal protein S21
MAIVKEGFLILLPPLHSSLKGLCFSMSKRKANIVINVNSNVEKALKQLKKKIEREGIVRDMKRVVYHESPSQKKRKRFMRAVKQNYIRMASQKLI